MAGMLIGTLNYMSPEQITGQVVDNRSDIFAIGAVMYELLSLRQAFPGGLHSGIIHRILNEHPPPLESLCPGLHDEVLEVVGRALEKDPQDRYQDLAAMRRDLQRARQRADLDTEETVIVKPDPDGETLAVERPPEKRSSHLGPSWHAAGGAGAPPRHAARRSPGKCPARPGRRGVRGGHFRRRARASSGPRGSNRRRDHRPCAGRAGRTRGG